MKLKALVAQLCLTLSYPMDCSPPGSSVHGTLHVRILEWVAILFSRGSSWPRDWAWVSCIAGRFFTIWATREAHLYKWKHTIETQTYHTLVYQTALISPTITKDIKSVECKIMGQGSSLVVQWLRICLATQGTWVQPLIGELRSHMLRGNCVCVLQLLSTRIS